MNLNGNTNFQFKKLDSAGIFFPATSNDKNSNVFIIKSHLKLNVDEEILKKALHNTLKKIPSFRIKLKKNFFSYYFEYNEKEPIIHKDIYNKFKICKNNNNFLFRISYKKNCVTLEVFHVLTDAIGAINFLEILMKNYIYLSYPEKNLKKIGLQKDYSNAEDAFKKYAKHYNNDNKIKYPTQKLKTCYIIKSKNISSDTKCISGFIELDSLKKLAKSKNVTITSYITALYIWSIYKKDYIPNKSNTKSNKIGISVPVDLRKFFTTQTIRNFFACLQIYINVKKENITFDEILDSISKEFEITLNKSFLLTKINSIVSIQDTCMIKLIPLYIKRNLLYFLYKFLERTSTSTVSNLGIINFEHDLSEYIDYFEFFVSISKIQRYKLSICSYNNIIAISFNYDKDKNNIIDYFYENLENQGLNISYVES